MLRVTGLLGLAASSAVPSWQLPPLLWAPAAPGSPLALGAAARPLFGSPAGPLVPPGSPLRGANAGFFAAAASPATPTLPKRQRSEPTSPPQRRVTGIAGPVALGVSRVAAVVGGRVRGGTVAAYTRPWYEVRFDDGEVVNMRGHTLAGVLVFTADDFLDPNLFHFDFTELNPGRLHGWTRGMLLFLERYGAVVPPGFLSEGAPPGLSAGAFVSIESALQAERELLQASLRELSGEARSARTLANMQNPTLKALWWLASRRRPLPPSGDDAAEYLTYLTHVSGTTGATTDARNAIALLCMLNDWDRGAILDGKARIPVEAMRRRNAHQVKKAAGLTVDHVRAILRTYAYVRPEKPPHLQWELAFGIGLGAGFKTLARHDDLRQMRYDAGFFELHDLYASLYIGTRKNDQEHGNRVDVAKPADPNERGVYHALALGHAVFGGVGFIMPHVDAQGVVHRDRPMEYRDFVRYLRQALVTIGVDIDYADHFAGHSMRSGGASAAARAGLPPHEICHLAGVKDINWLLYYMRHLLEDRLRASWSIGL